MKASSTSLFQPTTLTMLSGFATIIATTIALGSMAQDQSGQAVAIVSNSFRTELGSRNEDVRVISVNANLPQLQSPEPRQLPSLINKSFAQVKMNVDPQQDFANLRSELERIVGEIKFDRPMREIRVNIMHVDASRRSSQIHQICELLATAESELARVPMKIEIQTWAASPTPEAWVEATQEANRLRDQVLIQQSTADQPQCQISTSAGLWPHANQLRPHATVVLRVPVTY